MPIKDRKYGKYSYGKEASESVTDRGSGRPDKSGDQARMNAERTLQ